MKIKVSDLKQNTSINETLLLNEFVKDTVDLIKIDNCLVKGNITKDFNTITFNLNIDCEITQKCNITLLPVKYPLNFQTKIIYSDNFEVMDHYLTEIIDLNELVFSEIMVEKKIAVYHESANRDEFSEEKEVGHPAFKVLKDLIKEEE